VSGFHEDPAHQVVGSLPAPKLGVKLIKSKRDELNSKRRLNESYLEYAAATEGQGRSEKKRRKKCGGSSPRRVESDQDRG
jgi:hypothetical protein